jgi:hypothetical protein
LPDRTCQKKQQLLLTEGWSKTLFDEVDLPIITPSIMLNGQVYQLNCYTKPMPAHRSLKDLLGGQLFKRCLHTYMQRWNGRHPIPWGFFFTFNNVVAKKLNYFLKSWLFENSHIDFAIDKVSKTVMGYSIAVKKIWWYNNTF